MLIICSVNEESKMTKHPFILDINCAVHKQWSKEYFQVWGFVILYLFCTKITGSDKWRKNCIDPFFNVMMIWIWCLVKQSVGDVDHGSARGRILKKLERSGLTQIFVQFDLLESSRNWWDIESEAIKEGGWGRQWHNEDINQGKHLQWDRDQDQDLGKSVGWVGKALPVSG